MPSFFAAALTSRTLIKCNHERGWPSLNCTFSISPQEIFQGQKYKFSTEEEGFVHKLVISNPTQSDMGKYTCDVNNVATSAYLDVEGKGGNAVHVWVWVSTIAASISSCYAIKHSFWCYESGRKTFYALLSFANFSKKPKQQPQELNGSRNPPHFTLQPL